MADPYPGYGSGPRLCAVTVESGVAVAYGWYQNKTGSPGGWLATEPHEAQFILGAAFSARDYIIKVGDEYVVWWEAGCLPDDRALARAQAWEKEGRVAPWHGVVGHRWAWTGMQKHATRFTWSEARDVVWNKLKTCTRDGMGNKHPEPIPDRWAYKIVRLVPAGDTIRPADKRRRR
jgi:hypothetical protein